MCAAAVAALRTEALVPKADRVAETNGCDRRRSAVLTAVERAALTSADVAFIEAGVDVALAELTPRHALIEMVPREGNPSPARERAVARAHRLAEDGWRVVWIAATAAGDHVSGIFDRDAAGALSRAPHPFATALNGLAG